MFSNIIPVVKTQYGDYKPDLLIIIKNRKIQKASFSDKANKQILISLLWSLYKELSR